MTDRMTPEKQQRVKDVIDQLNEELHPLVIKAVLIDPIMTRIPLTKEAHLKMFGYVLTFIQELISLVVEQ